jgi:hypothetical protein
MTVYWLVFWYLQMIGSSKLATSDRDQRLVMLVVVACGSCCFDYDDDVVECLSLDSDLYYRSLFQQ